ncbi:MAG: ATP phosphoribosyltransferase regulatory subunit [Pseudomonadota bacterium]
MKRPSADSVNVENPTSHSEKNSILVRLDSQTPWLMPDGIRDYIGEEVSRVESLRRNCLKLFSQRGFQHVIPPPIEYLDSLLWGGNQDLALQTLKVTDQMSGQLMGFRADITPQIARIDRANIAQRQSIFQLNTQQNNSSKQCSTYINRFSYIGHVLHAKPTHLTAPRHLMQAGVEVFGGEVAATDLEILLLLIDVVVELNLTDLTTTNNLPSKIPTVMSIGHVGIIHALCEEFNLSDENTLWLISVLRRKSQPDLHNQGMHHGLSNAHIELLDELMNIYGSGDAFQTVAKKLPSGKAQIALQELRHLFELAQRYFLEEYSDTSAIQLDWFVDPLTIPSYDYHTGFVFSFHCGTAGIPIASGGRYQLDHQGVECPRSGTGFSLDLLSILPYVQNPKNQQDTPLIWVESNLIQQGQLPFYTKLRKTLSNDWKIQWASGDPKSDMQQKKRCSHELVVKNATEFELQKIN